MSDLRPTTRLAEVIVALAAGLALLGATAAAHAEDTARNGTGVVDRGSRSRIVNTIHPIVAKGGVVIAANGVTWVRIQNGPNGVAVYSGIPGTITISNGTESKTLSGGTLTLSGDVTGVRHAQGIQVGARNRQGDILVAVVSAPQDIGTGVGAENADGLEDHGIEGETGAPGASSRSQPPAETARRQSRTETPE